jgi:hypothetical protein
MTERSILAYEVKASSTRCRRFISHLLGYGRSDTRLPDLLNESI